MVKSLATYKIHEIELVVQNKFVYTKYHLSILGQIFSDALAGFHFFYHQSLQMVCDIFKQWKKNEFRAIMKWLYVKNSGQCWRLKQFKTF